MASTQPHIELSVDPDALGRAAADVRLTGARINTARDDLQRAAVQPLFAIPVDSDLSRAYLFAWGRWSAVLDDAYRLADTLAASMESAAGTYDRTEHALAQARSVP